MWLFYYFYGLHMHNILEILRDELIIKSSICGKTMLYQKLCM